MENNWFKKAEDLEEAKTNILGASYFTGAGDLSSNKPSNNMSSHFTKAGDLEETKKGNNSFVFEESNDKLPKTPEEIKEWLNSIVSGEKKSNYAFGEGLQATSAGQKFVTIEELTKMIDNGDNIISANYFENMNMVLIEFESFSLSNTNKSR